MASLIIPLDPVPASRPRVTQWGTYYAKQYKAWKKQAEQLLPHGTFWLDASTPLIVVTEAIIRKPRTSKAIYPKGDADNYAKGPLDVLTKAGGYWGDDRQIVCLISSKRFARKDEQPRTEVHIYTCD